ncbi:MAG TPA: hypothetical protein DD666_06820 [Advenella kashmirensis]|uniref:Uncharacterized protein n=1 Tax=Advenella kashmirensis TaxID=310575 RepID=A0A356LDN8_9BURK|nr:hypothetical protein [Advenella kashmirensis]
MQRIETGLPSRVGFSQKASMTQNTMVLQEMMAWACELQMHASWLATFCSGTLLSRLIEAQQRGGNDIPFLS